MVTSAVNYRLMLAALQLIQCGAAISLPIKPQTSVQAYVKGSRHIHNYIKCVPDAPVLCHCSQQGTLYDVRHAGDLHHQVLAGLVVQGSYYSGGTVCSDINLVVPLVQFAFR